MGPLYIKERKNCRQWCSEDVFLKEIRIQEKMGAAQHSSSQSNSPSRYVNHEM